MIVRSSLDNGGIGVHTIAALIDSRTRLRHNVRHGNSTTKVKQFSPVDEAYRQPLRMHVCILPAS